MEILSYVFNIAGVVCFIVASLLKGERMRTILFLVSLGNVLVAVGYLVGGSGFNCAASCLVAGAQTVVNYFFDAKGKQKPTWLIALYALMLIAVNLWVSGLHLLTLLAIVACMLFILSIFQPNGHGFRICTMTNTALWGLYDVLTRSWSGLVTHVTIFLFTLISAIVWAQKAGKNA